MNKDFVNQLTDNIKFVYPTWHQHEIDLSVTKIDCEIKFAHPF